MKRIGFIDGRRIAGWSFPATASPGNGQVMDVTDPSLGATGNVQGRCLKFRPTGDKTGTPFVHADKIELYPQGNVTWLAGHGIHVETPVGSPVMDSLWAQDIYMDRLGTAVVSEYCGISIGVNATNAPTLWSAFLRCYAHGTGLIDSVIVLPSSRGTTNLVRFHQFVEPIVAGAVGVTQPHKIRVQIAATDYYIPLYTT